jgi:hypothetical protein
MGMVFKCGAPLLFNESQADGVALLGLGLAWLGLGLAWLGLAWHQLWLNFHPFSSALQNYVACRHH